MNSGPSQASVYPFPGSGSAAEHQTPLDAGGGGPHPPDMAAITERVAKLEGAVDGLKSSVDALRWVLGILAVIVVGGISFLGFQITRIDTRVGELASKVDQLPDKINNNM